MKPEYDRSHGAYPYKDARAGSGSSVKGGSSDRSFGCFFTGKAGARLLLIIGCLACCTLFTPYLDAITPTFGTADNFVAGKNSRRMLNSRYGLAAYEDNSENYSITVSDCDVVCEDGEIIEVFISASDVENSFITSAATIDNVLDAAGMDVTEFDIVEPARDTTACEGMHISIQRVTFDEYSVTESIPYDTIKRDSTAIAEGVTSVAVHGKNGVKTLIYKRKYIDGVYVGETLSDESITEYPVTEVLEIGASSKDAPITTVIEKATTTARKTTTTAQPTTTTTSATSRKTTTTEAPTLTTVKSTTTKKTTTASETTTSKKTTTTAAETSVSKKTTTTNKTTTTTVKTTTTEEPTTITEAPVTTTTVKTTAATTKAEEENSVKGEKTFVDSNGRTMTYTKLLTGEGTAYNEPVGSLTSTGAEVQVGIVAVDPKIIPYGTNLYIESVDGKHVYGYAIAGDTGGALLSGRVLVDLFYDTESQCLAFGRRDVNVYILD